MKSLLIPALAFSLSGFVHATVSIEFQLGGVEIPTGSLAVLVADTNADGFTEPGTVPGSTLSDGQKLGPDDVIVKVFTSSDLTEWGSREGFAALFNEIDYEALGVAAGQELILHLFPAREEGESTRTGEPHLSYRTEDLSPLTTNSTMGFVLPADGGSHLIAALATENGGVADLSAVDIAELPYGAGPGDLSRALTTGARHTYFLELSEPGFLQLTGSGEPGLRAELYGPDGQLITTSDGRGGFTFSENLVAGFHTLVLFRDTGGPGSLDYGLAYDSLDHRVVLPDLAVGSRPVSLIGAYLYGGAAGQSVSLRSRMARPVTAHASVANRGEMPEVLTLRGSRGTPFCGITYLGGNGNVTAGIIGGLFRTPVVKASDGPIAIRVLFKPNKKRLVKKTKGRPPVTMKRTFVSTLRAESTSVPALPDQGTIRVMTR